VKRSILIVGLAVVSLILVLACAKQEEPAKTQKPVAGQKAQVPAEKAAPAQPVAAKREPTKQEPEQKEPAKEESKKPEPAKSEEKHGQKSDLDHALFAYLVKTGDDPQYANPHQTAQIDLNGDGHQDALLLLQNPIYFCGTGGCTMLVFKGTQSGFEFVSRSTLIRGPVLVSETKTRGWRDLIVEVSGGGIAPKQVALKYTGSKYPMNPSTLPALPKNQLLKGTKIFQGKP
jgi:putative lipoprotein